MWVSYQSRRICFIIKVYPEMSDEIAEKRESLLVGDGRRLLQTEPPETNTQVSVVNLQSTTVASALMALSHLRQYKYTQKSILQLFYLLNLY